jgi:hypothetical protein
MSLIRISVTVPRDVLSAADRRARALDRSRSWLVVEALRHYLRAPGGVVREAAPPPYAAGLGPSRLTQLEADLALSPEERVREAERTAREAELARPGGRSARRVLQFDRYEDYLDWKNREGLSG